MDRNSVRSSHVVGSHHVMFSHGLPESVEEFIVGAIEKYPELFPAPIPILVRWEDRTEDRSESPSFFSRRITEPSQPDHVLLTLTSGWWNSTPEKREHLLVMEMLLDRLTESGQFEQSDTRGVRIRWDGEEFTGPAAVEFLDRLTEEKLQGKSTD